MMELEIDILFLTFFFGESLALLQFDFFHQYF